MKGGLDYPSLHARFYRDYGGFPDGSVVKNLPATVGDKRDLGSISGSGRSPGGGCSNPLQYSCLKNPKDRGAWWATVHKVTKPDTTEAT